MKLYYKPENEAENGKQLLQIILTVHGRLK